MKLEHVYLLKYSNWVATGLYNGRLVPGSVVVGILPDSFPPIPVIGVNLALKLLPLVYLLWPHDSRMDAIVTVAQN